MKVFGLVILALMVSMLPVQQQVEGRILIDVGHSSQDVQRILNDVVDYLEIKYYYVEFTKTIMYLDPYDVLVIAIPTQPFTEEELASIKRFVENGGGLLLLGESGVLSSKNVEDFNVLAGYYGIKFQRDVVVDPENNLTLDKPYPEIPIIENFANHPVTRNVQRIFLVSGCSLQLSSSAKKLAWGGEETYGDRLSEIYGYGGGSYEPGLEKRGEELVIMACAESEKGRIVAMGDTSLFRGKAASGSPWPQDPLEYLDHKRLALNIVNWLSVKGKIERASELIDEAESLIEQGRYQEAKDILEDLRSISQQAEDAGTTRQVAVLLFIATKGAEADQLVTEGESYLEDLNCEEASIYFEEALTIYRSIGDEERAEKCLDLLTECGDTTALLQKADLLLEEGKELKGEGKYAEALQRIEEAKPMYEQLEIARRVDECNTLIEELQEYVKGKQETEEVLRRNRLVLAVILVITTVIIAALILWRRSKRYEEYLPHRE